MLTHRGTQTIETPRLILRRAVPEDAQFMFDNWASDPEVTRFLTWPTYETVETAVRWIGFLQAGYEKPDNYNWMIELREIHQPIGSIGVVEYSDLVDKAEIGYCIGKKWWHRGIMTEALQAVTDFLFRQVGMNRVEARHDTNNPHSGDVMKKCGMQYEGTSRSAGRNNQGICDIATYAILRSEWESGR